MRRYTLAHRNGIDGLELRTDAPVPQLRSPTDVLIKIKALSLNARDLQIANGDYPAPHPIPDRVVPVSDGCGVIEAVGSDVTMFKVGDRVAPVFPQGHHHEEDMNLSSKKRGLHRGLGGGIDGVAAESFVCDEEEVIAIPSSFTYVEGATIPVAFATAWSSLYSHHPKLQAGNTIVCLGTGGVSLCAAQLGLAGGAKVILTSSNQSKLDRAVRVLKPLTSCTDSLETIDYSKIQDWDSEVRRLNGGRGVDFVIEIAGRGTIARSIRSTRPGGLVAVSGYLSDYNPIPRHILDEDLAKIILYSAANVRGVFVCNREALKVMSAALEIGGVQPIVDKIFDFADLKEAYSYLAEGKHFGKVCIKL